MQALRLTRHACLKGDAALRSRLTHLASPAVRDLLSYRCDPDPFKGDIPWKRVQELAKDTLTAMHAGPEAAVGGASHALQVIICVCVRRGTHVSPVRTRCAAPGSVRQSRGHATSAGVWGVRHRPLTPSGTRTPLPTPRAASRAWAAAMLAAAGRPSAPPPAGWLALAAGRRGPRAQAPPAAAQVSGRAAAASLAAPRCTPVPHPSEPRAAGACCSRAPWAAAGPRRRCHTRRPRPARRRGSWPGWRRRGACAPRRAPRTCAASSRPPWGWTAPGWRRRCGATWRCDRRRGGVGKAVVSVGPWGIARPRTQRRWGETPRVEGWGSACGALVWGTRHGIAPLRDPRPPSATGVSSPSGPTEIPTPEPM